MVGSVTVCLPRCDPANPICPADFVCAGVKATYCAPVDGVCCVDGDGDGFGDGDACFGPDCDDGDPDRHPGASELCNGGDDDCDAATADGADDPALGALCDGGDADLCAEGATACLGGVVACADVTGDDADVCNGADDDCDPATTDGAADPLVGMACDGPDGDLCAEGTWVCSVGSLVCTDSSGDGVELCNGLDDDCDAATADGSADPAVGVPCDGPDTDACAEGVTSCAGGAVVCGDTTGSAVELCNGVDDDCIAGTPDGSADPAVGIACDGADGDLCAEGLSSCVGGAVVCSDATGTTTDVCNGFDDDCDPASADGAEDPAAGGPCDGPDTDLCAEGTASCVGGGLACSDATGSSVELCNGLDDDCNPATADGSADPAVGLPCDGPDGDLCTEGSSSCAGGAVVCSDATATSIDACNGIDDDCDPASADGAEDPAVGTACDGADGDLCLEGTFACAGGALACDDATGTTADLCNGADDDCDASSPDGSEDPGAGVPCDGPDSDACAEGVMVCGGGALSCNDASGDLVEICNGTDDDCDGLVDEGFDLASDVNNCGVCGNVCSALCCSGVCTPSSATDCGACGHACTPGMLVINELQIDPAIVADTQGEWFELYNPNAWAIDLRGMVLDDLGTDNHTIVAAAPVLIPANGYAVLGINANPLTNGGVTVDYQYASFTLGNAGDEVILIMSGVELDRLVYGGTFDVSGRSKELSTNHRDYLLNDVAANWCTATVVYGAGDRGTPGADNTCAL